MIHHGARYWLFARPLFHCDVLMRQVGWAAAGGGDAHPRGADISRSTAGSRGLRVWGGRSWRLGLDGKDHAVFAPIPVAGAVCLHGRAGRKSGLAALDGDRDRICRVLIILHKPERDVFQALGAFAAIGSASRSRLYGLNLTRGGGHVTDSAHRSLFLDRHSRAVAMTLAGDLVLGSPMTGTRLG